MGQMTLQFHADPDELVSTLLPSWVDGVEVHLLVERDGSLRGVGSVAELASGGAPQRVFLRLEPFAVESDEVRTVLRANPDGLALTVGALDGESLRESMLSTSASDAEAVTAWRSVFRRARASMDKGGQWVGPTGATTAASSHRYSKGAARLATSGVALLPVGGTSRFEPVDSGS